MKRQRPTLPAEYVDMARKLGRLPEYERALELCRSHQQALASATQFICNELSAIEMPDDVRLTVLAIVANVKERAPQLSDKAALQRLEAVLLASKVECVVMAEVERYYGAQDGVDLMRNADDTSMLIEYQPLKWAGL